MVQATVLVSLAVLSQQLYQWTDQQGTVHVTDNPALVPKKVQKKLKQVGDSVQSLRVSDAPPARPAVDDARAIEPPSRLARERPSQPGDDAGKAREDAQRRLKDLEAKQARLESQASSLSAVPAPCPGRVPGSCGVLPNPNLERNQAERAANEAALKDAREVAEKAERDSKW